MQAGYSEDETDSLLQIQIPDNEWFADRGFTGYYHAGGNILFDEQDILNWMLEKEKQ